MPDQTYPRLKISDAGDCLSVVMDPTFNLARLRVENGVNEQRRVHLRHVVGPSAEILLNRDELRELFNWLGVVLHKGES